MEDKYLETEYSNIELEAEDLENVAGGRKWGDTGKISKGPVTSRSFIKVADRGMANHAVEDPDEVSDGIAAMTEHHSKSGGII